MQQCCYSTKNKITEKIKKFTFTPTKLTLFPAFLMQTYFNATLRLHLVR